MDKETARALGRLYRMGGAALKDFEAPTMLNLFFSEPTKAIADTMKRLLSARSETSAGKRGKYKFDDLDRYIAVIVDQMDAGALSRLDDAMQMEFWRGYYGGWESMSVQEAAEQLGCGIQNVYNLIEAGGLKAEKHGGRWIVWKKSVEERVGRAGKEA